MGTTSTMKLHGRYIYYEATATEPPSTGSGVCVAVAVSIMEA